MNTLQFSGVDQTALGIYEHNKLCRSNAAFGGQTVRIHREFICFRLSPPNPSKS